MKKGLSISHYIFCLLLVGIFSCTTVPSYRPQIDGVSLLSEPIKEPGSIKKIIGFESQFLDLKRNLYVYLPAGYDKSADRYPVIYMLDGNNLFKKFASAGHNWNLEVVLDYLIERGLIPKLMIVGIGNTQNRTGEYVPYNLPPPKAPDDKGLKAPELLRALVEELKPKIDSEYRTLPQRENTGVAGSSFGGTFAIWAALTKPEVFGKVLAFSPAFWPAEDQLFKDLLAAPPKGDQDWYIDLGGGDGHGDWAKSMMEKVDLLLTGSLPAGRYHSVFDPNGAHKEEAWTRRLPDAMQSVFSKVRP